MLKKSSNAVGGGISSGEVDVTVLSPLSVVFVGARLPSGSWLSPKDEERLLFS
jgi:hypothetical protein